MANNSEQMHLGFPDERERSDGQVWLGKDKAVTETHLQNFKKYLIQESSHPHAKKIAAMIKTGEINAQNFKEKLEPVGEEFDSLLKRNGFETVYSEV